MELEKYWDGQEVCQRLPFNMEAHAMAENHEDYNVRKSLKGSKRVSHVENVLSVILYTIHHKPLQ